VGDLLAHLVVGLRRLESADAAATEPDTDAAAYFRRGERTTPAAHRARAELARDVHRRAGPGAAVVAELAAVVAAAPSWVGRSPPVVRTRWGDHLEFEQFVATRVVELTVHGLDVAAAVDAPAWTTPTAREVTANVLVALVGDDPRTRVGWDFPTFVEAATGRRRLQENERRRLGRLAGRFPAW
jgi:Mycothiol maleylpyruvate isomerase N-terminal domain